MVGRDPAGTDDGNAHRASLPRERAVHDEPVERAALDRPFVRRIPLDALVGRVEAERARRPGAQQSAEVVDRDAALRSLGEHERDAQADAAEAVGQ